MSPDIFFSAKGNNLQYKNAKGCLLGLLSVLVFFGAVTACNAQHVPVNNGPRITRIPTAPPMPTEVEVEVEAETEAPQEPRKQEPQVPADEYQRLLDASRTVTVTQSGEPVLPAERGVETELGQNMLYDQENLNRVNLQRANQSLVGFPLDRLGKVDWVKAMAMGLIAPRATKESEGEMEILDQDIMLTNTKEMPYVRFPHLQHTQWLACTNCHDTIFKPVAGSTRMSMQDIFQGKYCGTCHDRVAFSTYACERCHSVEQATYSK